MSGFPDQSSLKAARSQANYLFEGDFRRKPNQNLSGASRSLDRVQLLQQAALQRQNREDVRRREQSSIKIQAIWRSHQCRKIFRNSMRNNFDRYISLKVDHDLSSFDLIIKEFIVYYHSEDDKNRFSTLIQLLLDNICKIKQAKANSDVWLFRIIKLLRLNMKHLENDCNSIDSLNLKFLDDFTNNDMLNEDEKQSVWNALIRSNFFSSIRKIIDRSSRDRLINQEPITNQLDRLLIDIITRSLDIKSSNESDSIRMFFEILLKGPLDSLLKDHYLPKIIILKPRGLQPQNILTCFKNHQEFTLLQLTNSENYLSNANLVKDCIGAVWLSYVFVKSIHGQIQLLSFEQKIDYLTILSTLVWPSEHLLNLNLLQDARDNDSDEDDDPVDDVEIQPDSIQSRLRQVKSVVSEIVNLINDQTHVDSLKPILFDQDMNPQTQGAIVKICNFTLAHEHLAIFECPSLYTIAFNWEFLRNLWKSIVTASTTSIFGQSSLIYLQIKKGDTNISSESWKLILPKLKLFCTLHSYILPTLDDEEFYSSDNNSIFDHEQQTRKSDSNKMTFFVDKELIGISSALKDISVGLIDILYHENRTIHQGLNNSSHDRNVINYRSDMLTFDINSCFKSIVRLISQIHARDSRKQFCPPGHWICSSAIVPTNKVVDFHQVLSQQGRLLDRIDKLNHIVKTTTTSEVKAIIILQELPFVTPFQDRVQMFHQLISKEKREHTSEAYHFGIYDNSIQVQIRRNYIYEDAFHKLSDGNEPNMKLPLKVSLINAVGAVEAGIDGGGLSKEFLSELLKAGFDPMRGFFISSKDHELYPNPSAKVLFSGLPEGYEIHFEFLGKMLGKAIYEKVMVELPFASFFLAKILSRQNPSDVDWHNLASLDPVLYKNLVYLKNYQGDVADLNLDFTITNNELDEREVVELKSGGSKIPVTRTNKVEYVHLVADYRLNKQIKVQCAAFKRGLSQLIDLNWLRMFDPRELQILISGAPHQIDMEDWKRHTLYANGYSDTSEAIITFWRVASEFDEEHKRKLLRFATSCSNPPLLGFRDLYPQFTIAPSEGSRLPTASTCMNLLKLPDCVEENVMRSKLLYAIDSNCGFELS